MTRVIKFTDAMHDAFIRPLIKEDSFKDALRVHLLAALDGFAYECYDLPTLEIQLSYGFLLTYAEQRSRRINDRREITQFFVNNFIQHISNEYATDEVEEINGVEFHVCPESIITIPGLEQPTFDDAITIATVLGDTFAEALLTHGNIPMYFDIALGYVWGETIEVRGNDCYDTILIMREGASLDVGRGLVQHRVVLDNIPVLGGITPPAFFGTGGYYGLH